MNVLIIEDELRAANHLKRLLDAVAPEMKVIRVIETIREALQFLQTNKPDLIFSDIQLADGLSFEIYDKVAVNCPIIFTTAYDQYAIEAFNTNGIDYLLKPIENERLNQALQKVKKLSNTANIKQLLQQAFGSPGIKTKTRFLVKAGDRIKSIAIPEIKAFYSFEKGTYILTNLNRSYAIDYSMDELENTLSKDDFFRVNRKVIVAINSCEHILAWSNSRLKITIDGMDEAIIVAREKVKEFKIWLDR